MTEYSTPKILIQELKKVQHFAFDETTEFNSLTEFVIKCQRNANVLYLLSKQRKKDRSKYIDADMEVSQEVYALKYTVLTSSNLRGKTLENTPLMKTHRTIFTQPNVVFLMLALIY